MAPPSYGPVHALLHSVTPTHASAGDSWTLTGKSGSVSCVVTAPFSWVLIQLHKDECLPNAWVCF